MRSTSDPLGAWSNRQRGALVAVGAALALGLAWALRPLHRAPAVEVELGAPDGSVPGPGDLAPLDRAAFAAHIWNPPPRPEAAEVSSDTREQPAPPPKLQLIGVAHDTGADGDTVLRAALYDPDTDKLHLVASGERIGAVRVSVDPEGVSLETAGGTARLALRDERGEGGR